MSEPSDKDNADRPKKIVHAINLEVKAGNLQRALFLGERNIGLYPDNEYLHTALAKAYMEQSKREPKRSEATVAINNAKTLLARACSISPSNNIPATLLASIALRERNYERALELIAPVYERENPANPRVMGIYCSALSELGLAAKMLPVADKIIALEPENPNGYGFKAEALLALHLPKEALEHAEKALTLRPGDKRATLLLDPIYAALESSNPR